MSFVPNEKNSALSAISSAVSAALGVSIIVPITYLISDDFSSLHLSASLATISLIYAISLALDVRGIMISGTML